MQNPSCPYFIFKTTLTWRPVTDTKSSRMLQGWVVNWTQDFKRCLKTHTRGWRERERENWQASPDFNCGLRDWGQYIVIMNNSPLYSLMLCVYWVVGGSSREGKTILIVDGQNWCSWLYQNSETNFSVSGTLCTLKQSQRALVTTVKCLRAPACVWSGTVLIQCWIPMKNWKRRRKRNEGHGQGRQKGWTSKPCQGQMVATCSLLMESTRSTLCEIMD